MKVEIINDIGDLQITKAEWEALVAENETNTIFQTYEWFTSWWSVFGAENSLFFILVYDENDTLLGFAPLAINNSLYGKRFLIFAGDGNADYLDFITPRHKKEVLYQIFRTIKQHRSSWKNILLRNIPACSTTIGLAKSFSPRLCTYSTVETNVVCPTLILKNHINEAAHTANKYSTKRSFNYFNKNGKLNYEIINNEKAIDKNLDDFFQQHIQRWRNTSTPSLFLNDSNKVFYRILAKTLLPKNQLFFSVIMYGDYPLAYHYGFDYNSVVTWYKPTFDIRHAKHSPGILLIRYLIQYCLDNKKSELDFTVGNEPFKNRFANLRRHNVTLRVFTSQTGYCGFCFKYLIKKFAKKLIGRN